MMKRNSTVFLLSGLVALLSLPAGSGAVDFEKDIWPILEAECLDCHGPDKQKSVSYTHLTLPTISWV